MPTLSQPRLVFIDNLRWSIILLVISMHAADTYSPLGNWYFEDRTPLPVSTLLLFAAWQMYLQAFFMGLLFFVAGSFVPASFDRKGRATFLRERSFRLALPVLFYMFVLGPLTEYYAAGSWTSTQPTSFANEWIKHIRNGEVLQENGPLWFCLALWIFCVVYAGLRAQTMPNPVNRGRRPPGTSRLLWIALLIACSTFLVRLPGSVVVLNMHLGDFPQYIVLFTGGVLAARRGWLMSWSFQFGMAWLQWTLVLGFAVWLTVLMTGGALQGDTRAYTGGWHWQSAVLDLWEAFTCVGVSVGLLVLFRDKFDSQSRLTRFLSDNAFCVYVFHPPILIAAAHLLHGVSWPPIYKFVVLTGIAVGMSFALSAFVFRRIPLLRAIL